MASAHVPASMGGNGRAGAGAGARGRATGAAGALRGGRRGPRAGRWSHTCAAYGSSRWAGGVGGERLGSGGVTATGEGGAAARGWRAAQGRRRGAAAVRVAQERVVLGIKCPRARNKNSLLFFIHFSKFNSYTCQKSEKMSVTHIFYYPFRDKIIFTSKFRP